MSADNDDLKEIRKEVHEINERLQSVERDFERYKGAVGAALVVTTGLVAFIKLAWGFIKEHITWQ